MTGYINSCSKLRPVWYKCGYCLWLVTHDKSLWLVTYNSYFKLRPVWYRCNCCLWLATHDIKTSRDYYCLQKLLFQATTSLVHMWLLFKTGYTRQEFMAGYIRLLISNYDQWGAHKHYCLWLATQDKRFWLVTLDSIQTTTFDANKIVVWLATQDKRLWLVTQDSIQTTTRLGQIKLLSVASYTRQEIMTGYIRLNSNCD